MKDEGIGIKEESLCKIFDKFVQIDNGFTRLNEGSGLGLSLVKSFVNLHEGSIDVKSSECKGTTFVVKLPIKVLDSSEVIYNAGIDNKNTIVELSDIYIYKITSMQSRIYCKFQLIYIYVFAFS